MRILHEKLHLQHHRHTGHLLHHKHTSYRGLAVVFMLAGLSMIGLNMLSRAAADSLLSVGGTVMAAVPTTAPVLGDTPKDTVTSSSVQISGTCPLISPQPIVVVTVNGKAAGSSVCDSANDFSVPVSLTPGPQQLSVSTQTITGGTGPASTPITFSYAPSASSATDTPILVADAPFAFLGAEKTGAWSGTISGGTAPYYLHIDWGDGKQDNYKPAVGTGQYSHRYTKVQPYNAAFYLTDSHGHSTTLQYAVASYSTAAPVSTATTNTKTPLMTPQVAGLYGLFVSTLAICGIIYLEAKHAHKHPLPIPSIG
jgi:hypothetical protein